MAIRTAKRTAKVKLTLTKRTVEALEPADKPWIAWDDRLSGFGCRVQPSGTKAFIVNYRAGDGGRKAPNKRVVVGRYGRIARGDDPAGERAEARGMPTLAEAFEDYMKVGPNRADSTKKAYRSHRDLHPRDWLSRPIDSITRRDVGAYFNRLTAEHSREVANHTISLLRSMYPCCFSFYLGRNRANFPRLFRARTVGLIRDSVIRLLLQAGRLSSRMPYARCRLSLSLAR